MDDVEELVTYNDKREQGSMTPFIISSSFYLDEISPKEDSLEERIPFKKTSLRLIASTSMKTTKKNETLQERFKFIFRNEDD